MTISLTVFILQENDYFAAQREVISEEMHNNIFKEMHKLANESKVERRKTFKKMSEHKSVLDHQHNALLASKRLTFFLKSSHLIVGAYAPLRVSSLKHRENT